MTPKPVLRSQLENTFHESVRLSCALQSASSYNVKSVYWAHTPCGALSIDCRQSSQLLYKTVHSRLRGGSWGSETHPGAQGCCLQASAEMTDRCHRGTIPGAQGSKGKGARLFPVTSEPGDSPLTPWQVVLGGPTSRLAPPLPFPCRGPARGWLQLTDLDGRVSAETLLELLHQGLHCLLRRLSCCYRVGNGAEVRARPTPSPWRTGPGHPESLELPPQPTMIKKPQMPGSVGLLTYAFNTHHVPGSAPSP